MSYFTFKDFRWLNTSMEGLTADGKDVYLVGYQKPHSGNDSDGDEFRAMISQDGVLVDEFIDEITQNTHFHNNVQNLFNNGDIDIPLATTANIGGIKAEQNPNTADGFRNLPIVLAGPTVGSVWGLDFGEPGRRYLGDSDADTEYLYLPGWALVAWLENPGEGVTLPFNFDPQQVVISLEDCFVNTSSIGWPIFSTNSDPAISPYLWGVGVGNAGKFLRIKNPYPTMPAGGWSQAEGENAMDWVTLELNTLSDVSIDVESLEDGQVLVYDGKNEVWVNGEVQSGGNDYSVLSSNSSSSEEYVVNGGGDEETVLNGNGEWIGASSGLGLVIGSGIGINTSGATDGQVLTYDGDQHAVKWADAECRIIDRSNDTNTDTISVVSISKASNTDEFVIEETSDTPTTIDTIGQYSYYDFGTLSGLDSVVDYIIRSVTPKLMGPVYFVLRNIKTLTVGAGVSTINMPQSFPNDLLVTIQFGIVKFEEIVVNTVP